MTITGPKKELLDLTKHQGQITIDDAVEKMDLAKTTVREHFTQLEKDEYIERSYERSGRGRPSLRFQLTKKGNGLYPSYEPEMMREFIRYLQTEGEHRILEVFFQKFWDRRYEKLKLMLEEENVKSEKDKARVTRQMLDEEGFMAEYGHDQDSGKLMMKECNCPFREIIKVTKLPCKLEKEFYQRVFGKEVERTSYIADGDFACTYCID
ncbi:helix-turn-helix transcriptional regulator [Gracilimonas mengyeensis]|uniref:Transcriptional regulator n=1 Tax=Gracilimonas mengyeensis TaxID=1302730 RepID=A0A521D3J2_9BACT|nr:DeoR family transcriptional regulator [Gracilimonas mengyeensis]SMO66227.1 transcriptional regulator [Gracilimonas mengyeensis]